MTVVLPAAQAEAANAALRAASDVADVEQTLANGTATLTAFPRQGALLVEEVSALAARENWDVKEIYAEPGRLDEVFRAITTHDATRARESRT